MNENKDEPQGFEEPSIDEFLIEEEDPDKEGRKKRRRNIIRIGASSIALVFFISSLSVFSAFINLPALEFVKISFQLSQRDDIQEYKKAVVAVEGNNIKGTGFNISDEGYIITNYHVIEEMQQILVHFADGKVFKARIDREYPQLDLAFLEIQGENLPSLKLAEELNGNEGDKLFVIGNPLAFYQIANKGEMIGLRAVNGVEVPVLAITAPVYRGNSGSPVINEAGEVVGVVFASTIPKVNNDEEMEGLAIPIEEVSQRLPKGLKE
ncbi:S1C family serine protease [Bacillus marasmi]|uniref:S1C family serine protease n=1 Tax=Bacillus marasmi TaxID=1926279 RepID=UPI0011CABE69|nr:serine protease [Bacillus marasmi]